MEKKLTKKEMYDIIKEVCADRPDIVDFCNHEQELLSKKKTSEKNNEENIMLTDMIINAISQMSTEEKSYFTITEILKHEDLKDYVCENGKVLSNSKVTSLLREEMTKENSRVVNIKDKKNSFYLLAK